MAKPCSSYLKIERREAELIPPSKLTPYEFKLLSDIDDQKGYRVHSNIIQMYRNDNEEEKMKGRDPVKVIKKALADALVYYYPLAGRLREGIDGKLMVECNGQGVLFIEADAKVSLDVFPGLLLPPFPAADELLFQPPGSQGILHCPLILIQVTRFICGGFTFACRSNHTMCDAIGLVQFLTAIGEMARGAHIPLVKPVWKRELLRARDPLRISCAHHVFHPLHESKNRPPCPDDKDRYKLTQCSFFFTPEDLSMIRNHFNISVSSNFDVLTAFLWRTRTIALNLDPDEVVRFAFHVNARKMMRNPPLPVGYYGNELVVPAALSTVGELCRNSLGYAVDLIKKAKNSVNEEFVRSTTDFLVKNGRPSFSNVLMYLVSDLSKMKFKDIDFGMGTCIYGGQLREGRQTSFIVETNNSEGKQGLVVIMSLPALAIGRFVTEMEKILLRQVPNNLKSTSILARL